MRKTQHTMQILCISLDHLRLFANIIVVYVDHWFQHRFKEVLSEKVTPVMKCTCTYICVYVVHVLQTPFFYKAVNTSCSPGRTFDLIDLDYPIANNQSISDLITQSYAELRSLTEWMLMNHLNVEGVYPRFYLERKKKEFQVLKLFLIFLFFNFHF